MNSATLRQRAWLILPCAFASAIDLSLTLIGQPAAYWSGDYSAVQEWNPLGQILLRQHPLVFAAVAVLWIGLFSVAILALPQRIAVVLSFALTLIHAVCAAAWFWRFGWAGIVVAIVYLFGMEMLWSFCWRRAIAGSSNGNSRHLQDR